MSRIYKGAVALLLVLLTGCVSVTTGGETSRVRLYGSVSEMVEDSALVVTGRVVETRTVQDIDEHTDFTLSTVEVSESNKAKAGDLITVRQFGSDEQAPLVPLLVTGQDYLLFLTSSGLKGELGSHYYVTGSNAGIYELADDSKAGRGTQEPSARQVAPTEGEDLPVDLDQSTVEQLVS
mgnify:FL=1